MKIFRFDSQVGKNIDRYNSSGFVIARVLHLFDEAAVNCAYLSSGGVIGSHQATIPQLFLVVQGEGWEKEEWHESGTETGMVAVIIEGVNFDPAKLMPPV